MTRPAAPVTAVVPVWSDWRLLATVVVVLFPLFCLTMPRGQFPHIDPLTNVYTAATIARTGSPVLQDYTALTTPEAFGVLGWVTSSPRGPVAQYPPGTAIFASVGYLFAGDGEVLELSGTNDPTLAPVEVRVPPLWPAALMASLATALAAGLLAVAVHPLVGHRWAMTTAIVMAAGTGLWLNGAHELWQHGVASMWVALGLLAASRTQWLRSGLALGAGVLTRPTLAVASAGIGLVCSIRRRDWRPAVLHGVGASVGVVALLAYNHWIWGELTITGGYGSAFTERLAGGGPGIGWYARNVLGGLVSPERGVFVWSPFLAVALLGLPAVRRDLPDWTIASLVGAAVLLLVQFRVNRYSGGEGFFSYRYPLEALVAAAPALSVAAHDIWHRGSAWRRALLYTTAAAVLAHGVALLIEIRV